VARRLRLVVTTGEKELYKMYQSVDEFLMTNANLIIFAVIAACAFDYFLHQGRYFDPGALVGFGVAGCIGLLGFIWRYWDAAAGLIACLLGGCIGSGMHRMDERGGRAALPMR